MSLQPKMSHLFICIVIMSEIEGCEFAQADEINSVLGTEAQKDGNFGI